ncbi:sigma-70 family RNA polymerase sigma factor [Clostridium sp. K25]|uniref:sigma-70 family RNA polymerase sigma factor n=1 Tax=Clostridium sp. K25 TaxID=1443109 RepID=UPI0004DB02BE|nr:sigma-70 family RNA polymerase sigma factor [Clostridium sp. K25]KEI06200.1 putative RNA polymerase sigma factor [Clostridium sp. K25]
MDKVKKTELLLKEYTFLCSKIQNLELEIETLKDIRNYQGDGGLAGVNYNKIPTSKTYKITSIVENELISNINLISKYEYELNTMKKLKQKVENALTALKERDKKIIQLFYFNKISNKEVAKVIDLTEQGLSKAKRKIINQMSEIIFVS